MKNKINLNANIKANIINQGLLFLIQIALFPVFIKILGVEKFGNWIILVTFASLLTFSDFGLSSILNNILTKKIIEKKYKAANIIFNNSLIIFSLISIVAFTILIGAYVIAYRTCDILSLAILLIANLITCYCDILSSLVRSISKYSLSINIKNIYLLIEAVILILLTNYVGSPVSMAFGILLVRLSMAWTFVNVINKEADYYSISRKYIDKKISKAIFFRAVSFNKFTLGNLLTFQGMTLIIGFKCGASDVVIFSLYRTFMRSIIQVGSIFSNALWPIFTERYRERNYKLLISLYKKSISYVSVISCFICLIIYLYSDELIKLISYGKIEYNYEIIIVGLIYAFIGGIGNISRIFIIALDRYQELANIYLLTSAVVLSTLYLLFDNIIFFFVGLLVVEIISILYSLFMSKKCIQQLS